MMRKAILMIGILLVAALLVGGCAARTKTMRSEPAASQEPKMKPTGAPEDVPVMDEEVPDSEPEMDMHDPVIEEQEPEDKPEMDMHDPVIEEQEPEDKPEAEVSVSKSDLDALKADLESMDFEDLGGLSE